MAFKKSCFLQNFIFYLIGVILFSSMAKYSHAENRPKNTDNEQIVSEILPQPIAPPLAAIKGEKRITLDWLVSQSTPDWDSSSISWLDNNQIIYSSAKMNSSQKHSIELININTNTKQLLGTGDDPVVSPDKQWIAFVQGEKEERQLWIMDQYGKNLKQISHVQNGLFPSSYFTKYLWSEDSKHIVLLYKENYNYDDPDRITPPSKIELIDVMTDQTSILGSFDNRIKDFSWVPQSHEILMTQERFGFEYNDDIFYELISTLNVETKEIRTLAKFNGMQQQLSPQASPDGRAVAFLYDPESPLFDVVQTIGVIKNDGISSHDSPDIINLTHDVKYHAPVTWSPNGDKIYVIRSYGAYKQIYTVDVHTGKEEQITFGAQSIQTFSISPDGSHIAWIDINAHGEETIRVALNDGNKIKNILTISSAPKGFALSEVREIQWNSPDYPVPMRGLLFMPQHYKKGKRYPLVVDIHGGGRSATILLKEGGLFLTSPLEWQIWTAKDYAVFVPEFRSSGSFGVLAITRDYRQNHELLFADLRDVDAGVDYLINQGIVDENRLVAVGHSAGARRVNLLTTISHRYKAIVSHEGWADDYIVAVNNPTYSLLYPEMGGSPLEVPENYLKDSALTHAKGATTPTLFLMGNPKLGGVDMYNTVSDLYGLLKNQGVKTEYYNYPDEGHDYKKIENRKDAFERIIKWVDDRLKNKNYALK